MAYLLMQAGAACPHCANPNFITQITADNLAFTGTSAGNQGFYHCANCGTNFGINGSAQVISSQQNAPVQTAISNWPLSLTNPVVVPPTQTLVLDGSLPLGLTEDLGATGSLGVLGTLANSAHQILAGLQNTFAVTGTVTVDGTPPTATVTDPGGAGTQGLLGSLVNAVRGLLTALRGTLSATIVNLPAVQPVSGTVSVAAFPVVQPVSGTVSVSDFPALQPVSGTLSVDNFPLIQPVSGTFFQTIQPVSVENFPAIQAVSGVFFQSIQPVSGTVAISNFPAVTGSVGITNWPATQPVSGTLTVSVSNWPATVSTGGGGSGTITFPANQNVTLDGSLPTGVSEDAGGIGSLGILGSIAGATRGVLAALDSPLATAITNWPAVQPVSGTVAISNFPAVTGSVAITNWPAIQPVSGTFYLATQPVSGSLAISNFPATQPVSGTFYLATQPVSGTLAISNFPATQPVSGSVAVSGTVAISNALTVATNNSSTALAPTTVVVGTTAVVLLAANALRMGALLYNAGPTAVYVSLGSVPTLSVYGFVFSAGGYYEVPFRWVGSINAIGTGSCAVQVSELTT